MALKDVLRPANEKQMLMRLKNMDSEEVKEAFRQSLNLGYFNIVKLIIEHTAIKNDKEFLNSLSEEINEMRAILDLFDQYRGETS